MIRASPNVQADIVFRRGVLCCWVERCLTVMLFFALTSPATLAASETVLLPQGARVLDALYSQRHGYVVLRLDDRLVRYDPRSETLESILLPQPPLSMAELDGDLVVGSATEVFQVDPRHGTVLRRLDSPVPARQIALGMGYVVVVDDQDDEHGVWWLSLGDAGEMGFEPLGFESRATLRQGDQGPVLFQRWLSTMDFRHLEFRSGRLALQGCSQVYGARSRQVWFHGNHVFLDSGQKLDFASTECAPGEQQELSFSTRLPVQQVAALCTGTDWVAVVQHAGGTGLVEERPAEEGAAVQERGWHLEIIASPLPKRLGSFPLPSLQAERREAAWGRYAFCDGPGRRVFVILQDTSWAPPRGAWGIGTFDVTALQDEIDKSKAWSELLR